MGAICVAVCFLPLLLSAGFLLVMCLRQLLRGEIPTFWSPITCVQTPKKFWIIGILRIVMVAYLLFGIVMFEVYLLFCQV